MNQDVESDLTDLNEIIAHLGKQLPKMNLKGRIDVAARLKGAEKTLKQIDEDVKEEIKARRGHKMGYVLGELFKAYLNIFPKTRVDLKKLEVEHPRVYAQCLVTADEERVTFEVK